MRQPGQLAALLATSLCLCLLTTTAFAQRRTVVFGRGETTVTQGDTLKVGAPPVERQLRPDEAHAYTLTLEENTFVQIVVEQRGIDVIVQVSSPTAKNLGDFDSPNGTDGPENVSFVAVTAGNYHVTVAPLNRQDPTTGKYEIKLLEQRQATEQELKTAKNRDVVKTKGIALLTDIDGMIAELRNPLTRIRAQIKAAQLLSQADEKRSLKYLTDAGNAVKEFVTTADPTSNEYIRNFQAMAQLRAEIITILTGRDPEAALDFLRSTRLGLDPDGNERDQITNELALELNIANQVAAQDPKRALQLARENLKKGFSSSLLQTIQLLRLKSPELAGEFANELVAKLLQEKLLQGGYAAFLTSNFVRSCRASAEGNGEGLQLVDPGAGLPADTCRDLLQKSYQEAMAFKVLPNVYTPEREGASQLLHGLQSLGPELDAVITGGSASVIKKLTELNGTGMPDQAAYQEAQTKINENGATDGVFELIEKVPDEMRYSLYTQLAPNAAIKGDGARARQIINENIPNPFQRRQALMNVDLQETYQFVAHGKVEDALRTIGSLRTARERATLLSQVARQIGPGHKRAVALNLLEQARAMLAPGLQAQDQEQMNALLELARAFARYDAKRAFEIVDPLVDQVNDICTAARTLEGFGWENYQNDELEMQNGNSVANVATQMTGALGTLAITNFERAKLTADRLRLPEVRLRAYLDIAEQTIQAR